jgi:hypothetical protein
MKSDPATAPTRPDWLYGTGATRVEKVVVWLTVAVALPVVVVIQERSDATWRWWHWLLLLALVADLVGGVVANSLGSAKGLYHTPWPSSGPFRHRILRNHLAFAALHVHPFVVVMLFPGSRWAWAAGWYAAAVIGVGLVAAAPTYLKRPAAMGVATLALLVADMAAGPGGLAWLGPTLVLKLVVAHAVPETPYRPGDGT